MDGVGFGLEKFDAIGQRREQLLLEFRKTSEEDDDEGDSHKPVRRVTLPLDTSAYVAGIPDSQFYVAAAAGRSAGKEFTVPGMRGEAVFPVSGRKDGHGGGSPADPDWFRTTSAIQVFGLKSSSFR